MRIRYITHPEFQRSMIRRIVGGTTLVFVGQWLLFGITMAVLFSMPNLSPHGAHLLRETAWQWGLTLAALTVVIMPIVYVKAVVGSYRLVGGLTRLEQWLQRQRLGQNMGAFSVRPGDDLEAPVIMLNDLMKRLRERSRGGRS